MSWNPFKRAAPAPRLHIVQAKPATVNIKRETGGALRQGMWVMLGDRIGILKDMNEFAVATVALVDADGLNVLDIPVPVGELRQAKRSELPAKRVAHLAPEQLERMGYAS